jgi:hypothetical protein
VAAKRPEKRSKTHAANGLLDPPYSMVRNAGQPRAEGERGGETASMPGKNDGPGVENKDV